MRRLTIFLSVGFVVVSICALLSAHAWSTYNNDLKIRLQVAQDQVTKLKSDIKTLKADNQLKDEKIVKLESQPK